MLFSQVIGTISKAKILKILMPTSPRMTIENYAAKTHTSITYTNIIDDIHGYRQQHDRHTCIIQQFDR